MTKAEKAKANMQWVRLRVALWGWTEEIEAQALAIIEFRKQLEIL